MNHASDQNMQVQDMIAKMSVGMPKAPHKKQIMQFYSQEYYEKRGIKAFVDLTWPEESKKPLPPGCKKVKRLDYSNRITAEYYARETPEFLEQLVVDRDEALQKAQLEYHVKLEALDQPPETAEDYHG